MDNKLGPALFIGVGLIIFWLVITGKAQNLINAANGAGNSGSNSNTSNGAPNGWSSDNGTPQQSTNPGFGVTIPPGSSGSWGTPAVPNNGANGSFGIPNNGGTNSGNGATNPTPSPGFGITTQQATTSYLPPTTSQNVAWNNAYNLLQRLNLNANGVISPSVSLLPSYAS